MSGKKKSLTSKLQHRRALKAARRERDNEILASRVSAKVSKSPLHNKHSPPISDDDRPSPVKRIKKDANHELPPAPAFHLKANRQESCDVPTDDDVVTDTESDHDNGDDSYEANTDTTSNSEAMSTGNASMQSADDDSESIADGCFDDVFEGFGPVADSDSPTSVRELSAAGESRVDDADSDDDASGPLRPRDEIAKVANSEEIEVASAPSTPAIRKSTRSRKVTAKVAALSKKSTPTEWETSDTDVKKQVYHGDVMVTSSAPPAKDESVAERDVLLKNTYKDLVPLRAVVFTSTAKRIRTVLLSKWMNEYDIKINKAFVTALASFKTHDIFVNLSRVDPAILTYKSIGKTLYVSFTLGLASQLAMCVSIVVVSECYIGLPGRYSGGTPRKEITGYFLAQEFERFAGTAGAVFNADQFSTFVADDAFKFGTYYSPNQESSNGSTFSARAPVRAESSMFSTNASPSSVAAPAVRPVLPYNAVIPLYDYRSEKVFDPAIHLNPAMYGKLLPSHKDFPAGSLALVAYTTGKYTLRTGEPGLGGNLMWAALLAAPKDPDLPDPPSPVKKLAASKAPRTPTKASPSKSAGAAKKK
ncbi:hypothetical protein BJ138DRAFT_1231770 [Hygrophoropsis aurantiaca]|uniref:Uncharacterized protein n=1 Tax=Hygrophoropsis aurantiaca TaxID=72124 RepID=A0ACB7ZWX3_9AGAM|nr:hypothetical protein BJ138DRAFT_1231770 [Hygrophoropsis aurantiaca]